VRRPAPATNAAVIFALDVSGSMDEAQRRLAKTFFFFALQGIRRQYAKVETVFLAHAGEAWEVRESQFFEAQSSGGTVSSSVFNLAREVVRSRYDPARFNSYFFLRLGRRERLGGSRRGGRIPARPGRPDQLRRLCRDRRHRHLPAARHPALGAVRRAARPGYALGSSRLGSQDDVWRASASSSKRNRKKLNDLEAYAAQIEELAARLDSTTTRSTSRSRRRA